MSDLRGEYNIGGDTASPFRLFTMPTRGQGAGFPVLHVERALLELVIWGFVPVGPSIQRRTCSIVATTPAGWPPPQRTRVGGTVATIPAGLPPDVHMCEWRAWNSSYNVDELPEWDSVPAFGSRLPEVVACTSLDLYHNLIAVGTIDVLRVELDAFVNWVSWKEWREIRDQTLGRATA